MILASEYHELDELGGGRFRSTHSLKPIAYRKDGNFRRIGNVMGATGDAAFPLGADELCQFRIDPRIAGKSPLFHFGKGQSMVRIALLGANNVEGQVDGSRTTFLNAWNGADLTYTVGGHRLQEDILLRAGHPRSFAFRIDSHVGFNPETLEFGSDFRILDPVLEPPAGSGKMAIPLRWLVSQSGGKYVLTCNLPDGDWAGWTLDPTLTLQPGAADGIDTFVYGGNADTNYGAEINIYLHGNDAAVRFRGLLKFDLSGIPVGAIVGSATLTLTPYAGSIAGSYLRAWRILPANSAWTEFGATWNYALASATRWAGDAGGDGGADAGCTISGTDFSATLMAEVAILDNSTPLALSLLLSEFNSMVAANHGFVLRQYHPTNADRDIYLASSDHATAALRPRLVVEYTLPAAGAVSISPAIGSLMPRGGVRISPVRR